MALPAGPDGLGLVATDEGSLLQSFRLDRAERTLRVGEVGAPLLRDGEEADYEGLCWDDGWFYATGSHARGRKKPDHQPSRHHLYRVRLEPGGIAGAEISHALGALLGADPILAAHYDNNSTRRSAASTSRVRRFARVRCCSACAARPWTARHSCSRWRSRTCSSTTPTARPSFSVMR